MDKGEYEFDGDIHEEVRAILTYRDLDVASKHVFLFPATTERLALKRTEGSDSWEILHDSYVEQGGEPNYDAIRMIHVPIEDSSSS